MLAKGLAKIDLEAREFVVLEIIIGRSRAFAGDLDLEPLRFGLLFRSRRFFDGRCILWRRCIL